MHVWQFAQANISFFRETYMKRLALKNEQRKELGMSALKGSTRKTLS